jgi:hypothetical protein
MIPAQTSRTQLTLSVPYNIVLVIGYIASTMALNYGLGTLICMEGGPERVHGALSGSVPVAWVGLFLYTCLSHANMADATPSSPSPSPSYPGQGGGFGPASGRGIGSDGNDGGGLSILWLPYDVASVVLMSIGLVVYRCVKKKERKIRRENAFFLKCVPCWQCAARRTNLTIQLQNPYMY